MCQQPRTFACGHVSSWCMKAGSGKASREIVVVCRGWQAIAWLGLIWLWSSTGARHLPKRVDHRAFFAGRRAVAAAAVVLNHRHGIRPLWLLCIHTL